MMDRLRKLLRGSNPVFVRDMRKEGWKLLEHVPRRIQSVANLELVPFLKGESYMNGPELVRQAREELDANYGQEDAEFLLQHQEEIQEGFRNFILVFTATIWGDPYGFRNVAYLDWSRGRWDLDFRWLDEAFYSSFRLLRLHK